MPLLCPRPQDASSQTLSPPGRPDNIDPATSIKERVSEKNPSSARVWEYGKLLRLALTPIICARRLQLGIDDFKMHMYTANWAVHVHTLDLATGKTSHGQQCFFRPSTYQEVERRLQASKPWLDAHDPAADFPNTIEDQACVGTRFHNATRLWAYISRYLQGSQDPGKVGMLGSFTRWFDVP